MSSHERSAKAAEIMTAFAAQRDLEGPAERRLAFRELGLAIGLDAVAAMRQEGASEQEPARREPSALEELRRHEPLRTKILSFWLEPEHRKCRSWVEHRDINEVMLATALAPEGFLPAESRTRSPRCW